VKKESKRSNVRACAEIKKREIIKKEVKVYMKKTSVFIDYESLFWSLYNHHARVPNLKILMSEIKSKYRISQAVAFGDFTKGIINQERDKLRALAIDIIDCATEKVERNYTDFYMLDSIYRTLIDKDDVEVFILFTGDGHFSSVVAGLVNFRNKEVGVMGVAGTVSRQLKESASWIREIEPDEGDIAHADMKRKIISRFISLEEKQRYPSFKNTVEYYVDKGQEHQLMTTILSQMLSEGLIIQEMRKTSEGHEYRAILCNIEKIKEKGLHAD